MKRCYKCVELSKFAGMKRVYTIEEIKNKIIGFCLKDQWIDMQTADLMICRFDKNHKIVENLLKK